jgi:hypothetical protein
LPGYIGWRDRFLGIDSWVPKQFKNTVSGIFDVVHGVGSKMLSIAWIFPLSLEGTWDKPSKAIYLANGLADRKIF